MSDDYDWTPHLQEGEEVLWQGRPSGRFVLFLMRLDYWMLGFIVFFIPIYNFVFLPSFASSSNQLPWPFASPVAVWTIQIVGALLYSVVRPWFDKIRRSRLRYAVTDRRGIRVDATTNRILSEKALARARTVEIARHSTLRIDPMQKEFALVPMDWRIMRTDKPRTGIGEFYFGMQMAVNGYDEYGFELRMLKDPEHVKEVVLSQITDAAA